MSTRHSPRHTQEIDAVRARVLAEVSEALPSARSHFVAAYAGKSRKAAITAFCVQCNGFDRDAIRQCSARACTLYPYRPYARERRSRDEGAAE